MERFKARSLQIARSDWSLKRLLARYSSGWPWRCTTSPNVVPVATTEAHDRGHLRWRYPTPPPPIFLHILRQGGTMLRQTLARSAWRTGRHQASAASRAFSATAQRPAEVELTIGEQLAASRRNRPAALLLTISRWEEGLDRRYGDSAAPIDVCPLTGVQPGPP